ncbi:uncharacterized protein PADG_11366 [Paracoccidioides brasiliensis Pb18]|uniref:Uncharacterized protein n=1 Tax=Paracoccidioides brasiliensis (strain Pb18) TaxID=502780 RepID=A0A0A0HVB2_PARBD|nr:uncharacterized protein PADG_11366 [Paracoccidioides brasiliensis Pb18]KGM92537.1 hypothetical protein PADG_11366 [Paracoccidioides brasiliensis Pb18]
MTNSWTGTFKRRVVVVDDPKTSARGVPFRDQGIGPLALRPSQFPSKRLSGSRVRVRYRSENPQFHSLDVNEVNGLLLKATSPLPPPLHFVSPFPPFFKGRKPSAPV